MKIMENKVYKAEFTEREAQILADIVNLIDWEMSGEVGEFCRELYELINPGDSLIDGHGAILTIDKDFCVQKGLRFDNVFPEPEEKEEEPKREHQYYFTPGVYRHKNGKLINVFGDATSSYKNFEGVGLKYQYEDSRDSFNIQQSFNLGPDGENWVKVF